MDSTSKSGSDRTGLSSRRRDFDQQVFFQSSEEVPRHITTSEPGLSDRSDTMLTHTVAPPVSLCSSVVEDNSLLSLPQERQKVDVVPPLLTIERSTGLPVAPRKSVSRLCFPFVTTSRRKKAPPSAQSPPTRHKYSCFPTKLSPFFTERPAPVHQRHKYHHHGYSLLALEHVKSFWSMREETWQGSKGDKSSKAYSPPSKITAVHLSKHLCEMPAQTSVPMSIHPRCGDISALRDPVCVEVDRFFISIPSWTLIKTLWMHDLHLAAESSTRLQILWDEDISDANSEPDWDVSRSTSSCNFSDDSETTLVDSETELESYPGQENMISNDPKFLPTDIQDDVRSTFTTPAFSPLPSPSLSRLDLDKIAQFSSIFIKPIIPRVLSSNPSWAADWHHRWKILKTLSQHNTDRKTRFSGSALLFPS